MSEQDQWAKYRWEFMRRSPEYKKDYQRAILLREKAAEKPVEQNNGMLNCLGYERTPEGKEEFNLCKKYGLAPIPGYLFDPDKSFDEIAERSLINPMAVGSWLFPNGLLRIDMDLRSVNSITKLIDG